MASEIADITLIAITGLPMVEPGADLGKLIVDALAAAGHAPQAGDVLVVCQKIVSKAEGRVVDLTSVEPSERALAFAKAYDKDARVVELVLREAREVLRDHDGHLITATGPGWICANSGLDRSNQNRPDHVTLLPVDADRSADGLRRRVAELSGVGLAVVVSDTFGRPWRLGQIDFAIGAAGFEVLDEHDGRHDLSGRELEHTSIAVADQLAAAAGLLAAKAAGVPAVLVRGYAALRPPESHPRAADLVRPADEDLFR